MMNLILKSEFVRLALCASFGAMACAPAAALPSSVKIVSDTGSDLTARAKVTIADGKVNVDFSRGLAIFIR